MRRLLEGRELADSRRQAKHLRETFQARPAQNEERMPFGWPPTMQEIGTCLAVIYSSDKWKNKAEYEDYKHIAEAPQVVLAVPDFLVEWHDPHRAIAVTGPTVELPTPMPRHFAVLAKLLGVQVELYDSWSPGRAPRARDKRIIEFRVAHGMLGAARMPATDTPFLFVYTLEDETVRCIIAGEDLDIEADGIVG